MRILELRFKNLNSLQGEWKIDFNDPEYINNGIFALTGPTGAGKSTILDAICLALYGETPRLGKITKSENEIMSRHTGECYAEVVFQAQSGIYRCHWEQRKARKSPEGALQDQRHEIVEANTGKIIENKLRNVLTAVEEKTGMDFKRFNRSILLAQGSFDSFLKADVSHKSEILEQITGTEIYSEISKQVHERRRIEQTQLDVLQAEIRGIQLLTDEEIAEVQSTIATQKVENQSLKAIVDQTRLATDWLKNIEQLQQTLNSLQHEKAELTTAIEVFQPKKQQLLLANKAIQLEGNYAQLINVREQLSQFNQDLVIQQTQLPMVEITLADAKKALVDLVMNHQRCKETHKEQAIIWQKVRTLDYVVAEKEKSVTQLLKQHNDLQIAHQNDEKKLKTDDVELKKLEENLAKAQQYLAENKADEWLVNHFFALKSQLSQLQTQAVSIENYQVSHHDNIRKITELELDIETKQAALSEIQAEKQQLIEYLSEEESIRQAMLNGKTLSEYRREKDALLREQALLSRIASLEEERKRLKDGEACVLCGSLDHPFVHGQTPEQDEVEIKLSQLDEIIVKVEEYDQLCTELNQKLNDMKLQDSLKTSELTQLAEKLAELNDNQQQLSQTLENLQIQHDSLNQEIKIALQPLNIAKITDHAELLVHLNERLTNWQTGQKSVETLQIELNTLVNNIQQLSNTLAHKKESLNIKESELNTAQTEFNQIKEERLALFGDQNVELIESESTQQLQILEAEEVKARDLHNESQQSLALIEQTIAQLTQSINHNQTQLSELEPKFIALLSEHQFTDEAIFLSARLPNTEREQLNAEAKTLEQREIDLIAREKDRSSQLAIEQAKNITTESLEILSTQLIEQENNWLAKQEQLAQLEFKLQENNKALSRIAEKKDAIDLQRSECLRWEKLHGLIGSADGKKFRNFAQGLTFELMVNHANRQLEKMTDRYLLMRDKNEPLKLNVIDNYQAGEERSTKNLSGGESFIISLALALGLSKMASRKVRVDSLFLDEGFGTLDEEALDTALAVLSNLHGEGKLIGVISHVSALKERIQTQIRVKPLSGGRSEITGPGCERI